MQERFSYIDALKGVAMLLVIAVHCINDNLGKSMEAVLGNGKHGVQIFFVISGMLTALSMYDVSMPDEWSSKLNATKRIFFKKVQKIVPAYYLVIFSILLVNVVSGFTGYEYLQEHWLGSEKSISFFNVAAHLFFINGFFPHYINSIIGVEWYIADLAIFYIVYCLFIKKYQGNLSVLVKMIIGAIIVSYMVKYVDRHFLRPIMIPGAEREIYDSFFNTLNFFAQFPCMLLGVFVSYVFSGKVNIRQYNKIFGLCGWIMLILMLLNLLHITESLMDVLYGIASSLIIIGMRGGKEIWIDNRLLRYIGYNSLEIYLIHFIVIDVWNKYCYNAFHINDAILQYFMKYCAVIVIAMAIAIVMRAICAPLILRFKKCG